MEKLNKLKNILKKSVKIGVAITLGTMLMGCSNPNGPEKTGDEQYGQPYDVKLGNGNYFAHNFFGQGGVSIDMNMAKGVNHYLGKGETYVKGLVNQFSNSLKDRPAAEAYFAQFINEEQNNHFQRLDEQSANPYSFDKTINGISSPCEPMFNNIISNIDNNQDRIKFIVCYQALSNEAYKYGLGNYANDNYKEMDYYKKHREDINTKWNSPALNNPFNINQDIDNHNCKQITQTLDNLLENVANNIGNDVKGKDLRNLVNISITADSLSAMHDLSTSSLKHSSCSVVLGIVDAMEKTARELAVTQTQNLTMSK